MTEQEARERWCPFARVWGTDASGNRLADGGKPNTDSMCIASRCMVWRRWYSKSEGFCGLAGKEGAP
jgi:hypothetical protein